MKKLIGFLFIVVVVFSIYNDFNSGSLPAAVNENKTKDKIPSLETNNNGTPYFEKEIQPGDTVISVLENELNEPIPVPIGDVVTDFSNLNEGILPEEIKYGQTYKFPDYRTKE